MSRTYKTTGINLKSIPLGESDRIVTILTREFGLIRAVAPGVRKPKSKLGGRSGLFVVNELLVSKGRSLDKIIQADTLESYPGLSKDLGKLAAAQYLAELVLCQGLSEQPQEELFALLGEHLNRIERLKTSGDRPMATDLLPLLVHGVYHLLALAGIAPQVHVCCLTQRRVKPDFTYPNWRVGFSWSAGGTVSLSDLTHRADREPNHSNGSSRIPISRSDRGQILLNRYLNAIELATIQQLSAPELRKLNSLVTNLPVASSEQPSLDKVWVSVERLLREYAQYHFGRSIRSAALMETYLNSSAIG